MKIGERIEREPVKIGEIFPGTIYPMSHYFSKGDTMNTPATNIPVGTSAATPQMTPTIWGLGQSLVTGYLAYKAQTKLGIPPDVAAPIAGGVASSITSALHAWAQKLHLSPGG